MIRTSKQLKDKVRNFSKGDNDKAKVLIRTFLMERFLERLSLSKYRNSFILKGGMLVASILGVEMRATMDIDTTVKSLPLNACEMQKIINEICAVHVDDNVSFHIKSASNIMENFEYPGIRMLLEASLDRMRQYVKLDISTNDIITPTSIEYAYKLMFEERTISLATYNTETLLAEKIQTMFARGTANTRMRDFYDIYEIINMDTVKVDDQILKNAFHATCKKRGALFTKDEMADTMNQIAYSEEMAQMWNHFREKNFFVGNLQWQDILKITLQTMRSLIQEGTSPASPSS